MNRRITLAFFGLLGASVTDGRQSEQVVTSLTAKDHVGKPSIVCGQVENYSCNQKSSFMTLTLAPGTDPKPLTIAISSADRTLFGKRVEDQFMFRVVCVRGTVEDTPRAFRVQVPDPTHITVQKQDKLPAQLPAHAYSICDPGGTFPTVLLDVKPQYTPAAMRDRVQGGVLMRGVVEADGTVGAIQVLESLHPELDVEAGKAFKQWRFKPGTYMGDPAAVIVTMEMTFSLRDRK